MSISSWLNAPTTATIGGDWFQVVESPADAFIERLEGEQNPNARLHFAARVLRHDPGCIEMHLLLAENANEMHVRFAISVRQSRRGMRCGVRWPPGTTTSPSGAYRQCAPTCRLWLRWQRSMPHGETTPAPTRSAVGCSA